MTELAKLKQEKNFTIKKISALCGYKPRMVQYMLSGDHITPKGVLESIRLEPREDTDKITRYEFIELLKELKLSPVRAATILIKHADRIEKMADPSKDQDRRIAIRSVDVEKLRRA